MDINALRDVPTRLTSVQKKKAGSLLVLVNYKFLISVIVVNFLIFFALLTIKTENSA